MYLSGDKDAEIIETFNSTARYLEDLLNIDNTYFNSMVNRIYSSELRLNKAHSSDTEVSFLDFYFRWFCFYKRDEFDFDAVGSPFLDGDIPRATSYGVYISQFILFASVCHDADIRNKISIAKLLK